MSTKVTITRGQARVVPRPSTLSPAKRLHTLRSLLTTNRAVDPTDLASFMRHCKKLPDETFDLAVAYGAWEVRTAAVASPEAGLDQLRRALRSDDAGVRFEIFRLRRSLPRDFYEAALVDLRDEVRSIASRNAPSDMIETFLADPSAQVRAAATGNKALTARRLIEILDSDEPEPVKTCAASAMFDHIDNTTAHAWVVDGYHPAVAEAIVSRLGDVYSWKADPLAVLCILAELEHSPKTARWRPMEVSV